jgi:transcriptional regulator with XRE-family HTH domain
MREWTADEIAAIADRLRRARMAAGFVRASDAVRKFGWNYSRYMNYENGVRTIPPKQAILFASAFSVTVDFIYFGKGDTVDSTDRAQALFSRMVRRIPLVQLENMMDIQRIASRIDPISPAAEVPISSGSEVPQRAVFIEIEDKSMTNHREPVSFEPGDMAMIDLDAAPAPADFVLALLPEEGSALFRLYREVGRAPDGSLIADLVPLNPNFRTIRFTSSGTGQIIGVCCQVHRILDLRRKDRRKRAV